MKKNLCLKYSFEVDQNFPYHLREKEKENISTR